MGSPRRRRQKRALGALLGTKQMNKDQRMRLKEQLKNERVPGNTLDDFGGSQRLRDMIEIFSHSPRFGGNSNNKQENFIDGQIGSRRRVCTTPEGQITTEEYTRVKNGIIQNLSELDLNATLTLTWSGPPDAAGFRHGLRVTDHTGTVIDLILENPDDVADFDPFAIPNGATNAGDEIFTNPISNDPVSYSPRRFLINGDGATGANVASQVRDIIQANLDISVILEVPNPLADAGTMFLVQNQAGPAGNVDFQYINSFDLAPPTPSARKRGTIVDVAHDNANAGGELWSNPVHIGGVGLPTRFVGGARAADARMFYGELHSGALNIIDDTMHGLVMVSNLSSLCSNMSEAIGGGQGLDPILVLPTQMTAATVFGQEGSRWNLHIKAVCGPRTEAGVAFDGDEYLTQEFPGQAGAGVLDGNIVDDTNDGLNTTLSIPAQDLGNGFRFTDAIDGNTASIEIGGADADATTLGIPQKVLRGNRPIALTPRVAAPDVDPADFNNNVLPLVYSEAANHGTQSNFGSSISGGAGSGILVHYIYMNPGVDGS